MKILAYLVVNKIRSGALIGSLLLWGCGSQSGGVDTASEIQMTQRQGRKAPSFELVDLSGKRFSLSDFKGRVVFLDFWATWCPPCVMSAPDVEKLAADYRGKNLEIISVSLDQAEEPVRRFMKAHKMSNRVALTGKSGIEERYKVHGIPAFFLIDKDGNLAGTWEGYHPSMPKLWRKEMDRLLGA